MGRSSCLPISTNKKLVTIIYLLSLDLYSQYSPDSKFYREDQFFIGSTYFIQTEKIDEFKQNGFSGNFQVGFIRDLPLNKNSTKALGIGFGYERNYFTSNIQPAEQNERIDYRIIVSRFLESKNKITLGIGSGNTSRVDSVNFAIQKSKRANSKNKKNFLSGSVMASDAFFPFTDSITLAYKAGIKSIIQPGGSLKDDLVIKEVDVKKLSMVFSFKRSFSH